MTPPNVFHKQGCIELNSERVYAPDKGVLQSDDPAEAEAEGRFGSGGLAQTVSSIGGVLGGGAAGGAGGAWGGGMGLERLRSASSDVEVAMSGDAHNEHEPELLWDLNLSTSSLEAMLGAGGKAGAYTRPHFSST